MYGNYSEVQKRSHVCIFSSKLVIPLEQLKIQRLCNSNSESIHSELQNSPLERGKILRTH